MKVVIPGGAGQVGTVLARDFVAGGHEVVVLSRKPQNAPWRVVAWDGAAMGEWATELEGAAVVVNLAGRSVNCRYNAANRRQIMDSRVISTRLLGEAIARTRRPPPLWLQASTATIYAHRHDAANDEATGVLGACEATPPPSPLPEAERGRKTPEVVAREQVVSFRPPSPLRGGVGGGVFSLPLGGAEENAPGAWRFSIDVAKAWEQAAVEAATPHTRKVLLRSAMTMSPDRGGVFDVLLTLVRWGLGGRCGDGRQYVSWIHDRDFVRAVCWLIDHPEIEGPVNLASPHPVPNAEFMRTLRAAWGRRFGLPAAAWMVEIGAFFLRTESELVLKSRRVVPGRLLQSGFVFHFPWWAEAAADLCRRWRERHCRAIPE